MTTSSFEPNSPPILPSPPGPPAPALFPDLTRDDVFRLETPRLWLRWMRHGDAMRLAEFAGLAEVAEMTGTWPHPLPGGEVERRIFEARKANATGASLIVGLTPRGKPNRLIGVVGVGPDRDAPGGLSLGYMLDPAEKGRGLMTEAVQAVLNTVFELTRRDTVSAWTRVINPASRRVLEKSGFRHVGTGLRSLPARGGMLPCDSYAIDRKTWAALSGWTRGPDRGREAMDAPSSDADAAGADNAGASSSPTGVRPAVAERQMEAACC
jgi:RimJ/RimL family protein N-acetyltransferase